MPAHDVRTAVEMGWSGVKNGELLALAAGAGFVAVVTVDKNLQYQQNLAALPIAVVILDSFSNEISSLLPLVPALERALGQLTPRTCVRVAAT